jgi:heat shock protein HtpX
MPPDPEVTKRPEIWEQQARNRRNTVLLMVVFTLLLVVLGLGVDVFLFGRSTGEGQGFFVPVAAVIALLIGAFQSLGGYYWGAGAVLGSARARPADPLNERERLLLNVVAEMRLASGLPMPKVYVLPDPDPNAFAVGRDPGHAAVAVTRGLLETLDRAELQGVIGHEMAHVRNLDIRTMTMVAALAGAVVLISDFAARMMRWGGVRGSGSRGRDRDSGGGGAAGLIFLGVWVVLILIAPLLAQFMAFAVSRSREYEADATSAEFTRNPLGLASALRKLDAAAAPTTTIGRGAAHLCIADPAGSEVNNREGRAAALFATHPPIGKRIAILEAMAGAGTVSEGRPAGGGC